MSHLLDVVSVVVGVGVEHLPEWYVLSHLYLVLHRAILWQTGIAGAALDPL